MPWQSGVIRPNPTRRKPLYGFGVVMRKNPCGYRLLAVLRIAARVGEVRNTAVMRQALGLGADGEGARKLSAILRHAVMGGYLTKRHLNPQRCVWTMTAKGRKALTATSISSLRETPFTRCRDFFAANPNEELSYADIAAKFGVTKKSAEWMVVRLVQKGIVQRIHVIRGVRQQEAA